MELQFPSVMGILNVTPDSFYPGSRIAAESAVQEAQRMLEEGATILDIGAQSTRPGAELLPAEEEWKRLAPALSAIRKAHPGALLSVDTFHALVADRAMQEGADLINDVSAGDWDPGMLDIVAKHSAPYILMHAKGRPGTMQEKPSYKNVTSEVMHFLAEKLQRLREKGIADVLVDPGFGFGKSREHNFELLRNVDRMKILGCPVVVGVSRKSMIGKTLGVSVEESLNGSTILHTWALIKGVDILRVHDVKEAVEVVKLVSQLK